MADASGASSGLSRTSWCLRILGVVSTCGYLALTWLSFRFTYGEPDSEKPTIAMLAIFAVLFFCYWVAISLVTRLPPTKGLLWGTIASACLFRVIMLPSVPMHEIDIYRYLWDGAVLVEGTSPYRYSPQQVKEAIQNPIAKNSEDLQGLAVLRDRSESLAYSLDQIHYSELSSPYPPVSQVVFALAAGVTPDWTTAHARLVIMKWLLVLFDLATLLVVVALLHEVGHHPGLNIAYGWCPLVLKEFANGGHLDSIAIFFCTFAIFLLVRGVRKGSGSSFLTAAIPGVTLALAIAAKLYPVILLPLFVAIWWHQIGIRTACYGALTVVVSTVVFVWPMFAFNVKSNPLNEDHKQVSVEIASDVSADESSDLPPAGLKAFLKHWEMNDLLFMVVLENLRPQAEVATEDKPWFVVVPDNWSRAVVGNANFVWNWSKSILAREPPPLHELDPLAVERDNNTASFLLARFITAGFFVLVACRVGWQAATSAHAQAWCRAAMLTLAWFWLTCPTQNPWYWCWVVPFLPFARYRTWYLIAGCTMLYYLRFWLAANFSDSPVWGTPYHGESFFYFVVVWIEFAPVLLLLGGEWLLGRRKILLPYDFQK